MSYRVLVKRRITDAAQVVPAADAREAQVIKRFYTRKLWIAVVQYWNNAEQRWIG